MRVFRYSLFLARTWALPFVLGVVASTYALVYQLNSLDNAYGEFLAQQFQVAASACGLSNGY